MISTGILVLTTALVDPDKKKWSISIPYDDNE